MRRLDLSETRFSGHLPSCVTELTKLYELNLQFNRYTGKVPKSWLRLALLDLLIEWGDLLTLTFLNLSYYNLLERFLLSYLNSNSLNWPNLSNNMLQGRVPFGFNNMVLISSLRGNLDLCIANLGLLSSCSRSKFKPKSSSIFVKIVILLVFSALVLLMGINFAFSCGSIKWSVSIGEITRSKHLIVCSC